MNSINNLQVLLAGCKIMPYKSKLLIICPTNKKFIQIARQKNHTIPLVVNNYPECDQITIAVEGDNTNRVHLPTKPMPTEMLIPSFQGTTQQDLINEALSYEGACGIVRMSDHKGLFSNSQITLSSNIHPNDWLGKKMSDWWIPSELEQYLERLSKDQELRGYSYVAKMMTGENARLTVDARLVTWNGDLCRIVKTISRELLG
ncbi:MAG: hypothetical protein ACKPCP_34205 [Sphaerospermopsis kisseleviana]